MTPFYPKLTTALSAVLLTTVVATPIPADPLPQADNDWFTGAEATLQDRLARTPNTSRAKNVILMISDGNGIGSNYATRLWMGQQAGGFGDEFVLPQETFPHLALSKTYNVNAQTPDSAGTGTAMHTGVKTMAGVIGVDETLTRGNCAQVAEAAVVNAAEVFAGMGKDVGIVTTARLTHATPASAYAHSADRNFEDNSKLPKDCEIPDIARQLVMAMKAGMVDIAMGGGRRHFIPKRTTGNEGKPGKRTDGRNLIREAKEAGITYVWNARNAAAANLSAPLLGLFGPSHMQYEYDRTDEPSLAQMTEMAIRALEDTDAGFFLSIEAGRVDHANHASNAHRMVTDGAAFAAAVAKADEMTNDADTLIIVTADHGHSISFNGYCGRGSPITGLCMGVNNREKEHTERPNTASDGRPYTVIGYLNGKGSVLEKDLEWTGARPEGLDHDTALDPDYVQQALIPRHSETHSGADVAIYAKGPWAHLVDGTVEQNYIFHVMQHAASMPVGPAQQSRRDYAPVTR